jgi:enoyl-CoA hydratase/carnithine racemase
MAAAMEMAQTIAGHSAAAIQAAKRVIDAATLSAEADALEDEANRALRGSPEQVERFRSATQRVTGR